MCYWMCYKVLNMDILKDITLLQKTFIKPPDHVDIFYDGWVHFFGALKSHPLFTAIIKLGRARA